MNKQKLIILIISLLLGEKTLLVYKCSGFIYLIFLFIVGSCLAKTNESEKKEIAQTQTSKAQINKPINKTEYKKIFLFSRC